MKDLKYYIGIDIGSTCAKTVVLDENEELVFKDVRPTGWSSVDTAESIYKDLQNKGFINKGSKIVATGYGRVSVPYADKAVTEITCHARGANRIFNDDSLTVIDIGGQDTKIIRTDKGAVTDFFMNDKCSAGTGRFLEVMGATMGLVPTDLCELARSGSAVRISSMCTVFAESEVISLVGKGESKENIAFAIVDSIADKVVSQCSRLIGESDSVCLTGGLCECDYLKEMLEEKLKRKVATSEMGRYAGALGAALCAKQLG